MRRPKLLISESVGFSPEALDLLQRHCRVVRGDLDRRRLLVAIPDAEVLWIRLRHRIDIEVMDRGRRLKVIVSPTTGLNHIDQEEAARRGIQTLSLRGETEFLKDVRATAEHTVGLILALLRHIPAAVHAVRHGGWNRDLFRGHELYGKTVGIVGYGRLGKLVARYLAAFGARIVAADPNIAPSEADPGVCLVPLGELLAQADIVSIHVDLSDKTTRFFGRKEFQRMKRGAWLVNTARGELLDENALLESLRSGRLAGAAVDVLSGECSDGMPDHPLVAYARQHENLIITPHIGGCTAESMAKTEKFLAKRLVHLLGRLQ